jgi:hypothetical protein
MTPDNSKQLPPAPAAGQGDVVPQSPSAVQFSLICQLAAAASASSSAAAAGRRTATTLAVAAAASDVDPAGSLEGAAAAAAALHDAAQLQQSIIDERGRRHDRSMRTSMFVRRGRAPSRPSTTTAQATTQAQAAAQGPAKVIRRRRSVTPLSLPSTIRSDVSSADQI